MVAFAWLLYDFVVRAQRRSCWWSSPRSSVRSSKRSSF